MSFESSLQLQVIVLTCGLASFWAALSCGSNPLCSWLEWIDGHSEVARRGADALQVEHQHPA